MRIGKAILASALALSGLALAAPASAQLYVGASLGQSDISNEITTGLITSGPVDGKDSAFKLFAGYMVSPHFGFEGAWVDLGEASYSGQFFSSPVTDGRVEVYGLNIAALGSWPVTPEFSVFGKIGLFAWEAKANDITGGAPFSGKTDGTDLSFGFGASYHFTRNLGVRAEWERFKVDDADADLVSIGLVWRF